MPLKKYNTSSVLITTKSTPPAPISKSEYESFLKYNNPIMSKSSPPSHKTNQHTPQLNQHLYSLSELLPNIIDTAVCCPAPSSASATVNANTSTNSTCSTSNLNTSSSSSASSSSRSQDNILNTDLTTNNNCKLPSEIKTRLYEIFSLIEREFDLIYAENVRLKQQICDNNANTINNGAIAKNTSLNTNSSSTSTLVAINHFSPKKTSNAFKESKTNHTEINEKQKSSLLTSSCTNNNVTGSMTSSLTSSAITALTGSSSSSAKSSLLTSKNRINNLSFPKFKPNAREFIMQSIKNTSAQIVNKTQNHNNLLNCKPQSPLNGHKDGIWDINCLPIPNYLLKNAHTQTNTNQNQNLLIGTASADTTARLWYFNMHAISSNNSPSVALNQSSSPQINHHNSHNQPISSSICIQEYCGHTGSVNSLRFHPRFFTNSTNLILTSSGDCQAHIWQCVLDQHNDGLETTSELNLSYSNCYSHAMSNTAANSNLQSITSPTSASNHSTQINTNYSNDLFSIPAIIRSPIKRYEGHQDACIAAEWFPDGEFLATASWDRTANVYNVETGKILCNLQHDDYLTNVTIHKSHKIILTSSKDTTFKIWDFRDPICSVQIYQGHNRSVNSAIFIGDDKIATSSDDHTVKIWDLRIMRSPVCTINLNSSVNRICTMSMLNDQSNQAETYLCLPLDNRDIKVYNLNGERITRLPRNNRVGHRRLVTSLASHNNLLFSASFDKCVNSWSFDYNPSKSSLSNKASSNKENNELMASTQLVHEQIQQQNRNLDKVANSSSPSPPILVQLSNLITSPSHSAQAPPLTHITNTNASNNMSGKGLNSMGKPNERIKI